LLSSVVVTIQRDDSTTGACASEWTATLTRLPDTRLRGLGEATHDLVLDGDLAPAQDLEALLLGDRLEDGLAGGLQLVVVGHEDHPNAAHDQSEMSAVA